MATDNEIKELFSRICFILDVDYTEMLTSRYKYPSLARAFCVYFATQKIGANRRQICQIIPINMRNATKRITIIREGIKREAYYREPYELIEKGLSE